MVRRKLIVFVIFYLITGGCGSSVVKVPTGAMQPTIPIDSYVAWDNAAYSSQPIERFDMVVHTVPLDDMRRRRGLGEFDKYIFRVVGLGGEKIEIKSGQLLVNDTVVTEPFERIPSDDNFGPIVVPQGEYFLLGDNRPESDDSRFWKPSTIVRERIIGKVTKVF